MKEQKATAKQEVIKRIMAKIASGNCNECTS